MKKKLNLKAGLIGLAVLGAGVTVGAPILMEQTAITAEAASTYDVYRYISFYYKNDDGSTTLASQGAYQQATVPSATYQVTFAAAKAGDFLAGVPAGWKFENEDIPSVKGSYNNPPAEYKVYLVKDAEAEANAVQVTRTVNIYKKYSDGSTEKVGSVGQQSGKLMNKDQVVNFPATSATAFLKDYDTGAWAPWKPENNNVPAASGSYNNPPAAYDIYLVIDSNSGITQDKTITRTIKYYKKEVNGSKSLYRTASGSVTFPAGSPNTSEYTFESVNVEVPAGYTADRTVIESRKVNPTSSDFVEEVVFTKNTDVRTEEKTVWRWVNFKDKATGEKIKGSEAKGAKFTREVYTDANGKTVVVRDWQAEGTIPEHTVPDIEGYSHTENKIPAQKVNVNTEDFEVDVFYTKNTFTGIKKDTDGVWKIFKNDVINTSYTGFNKAPDGIWYYFEKGVHDPSYTGMAKSTDKKLYFAKDGQWDTSYTGLAYYKVDKKWYYVKNGRLNTAYLGVSPSTANPDKLYFVQNGKWDKSYTGLAKYSKDGKWYYVKNGTIDKKFVGLSSSTLNPDKLYYVKGGMWDKSFNGKINWTDGVTYTVKKGAVVY